MEEGVVAIPILAGRIVGVLLGVRIQARKDARRTTRYLSPIIMRN